MMMSRLIRMASKSFFEVLGAAGKTTSTITMWFIVTARETMVTKEVQKDKRKNVVCILSAVVF